MEDDAPHGPVTIPIKDVLDVHHFAPRDIPSVVASYVDAACDAGLAEVRVIHGRGRGIQRARVWRTLSRHPRVAELREATPERGGWGATVVRLRRS